MSNLVLCKICGKRRAKRLCPAVHGDICAICCGTEREVSLSCPLECNYLREAHKHEKPVPVVETQLNNSDIVVTEELLSKHEEFLLFCIYTLVQAAVRNSGAVDADVVAALEALIQTHRTLSSGLFYETKAENMVALAVQRSFAASLADYQKLRSERDALSPIRDSEVLTVLVFLYRIGQQNQNGRPRGRMFIDLLSHMTPQESVEERAPSIII
ncbi:MAG: hypothetical protein JO210_04685 [Acidobacteriaceae bacterium]|nr:hypothetical protein [Acidobacteriaceae bacterium]